MSLVAVDAHSKWPKAAIIRSTTTEKTIENLEEMFSCFGCPAQLVSDQEPQLVSQEISAFLQANGVQHQLQLRTTLQLTAQLKDLVIF